METMANEQWHDSVDHKEFAAQMRSMAVVHDGIVHVSEELWLQIADMLEGSEEIVRCKDCKKWKRHGMPFDITKGTCHNPRFHFHHGHVIDECFMPVTNETDFCSYGERRENE